MPTSIFVFPGTAFVLAELCFLAGVAGLDGAVAQNGMKYTPKAAGLQMTISKTDIKASPTAVFAVVDDFRSWSKWMSPEKAPVKQTFSGADKGKGAGYRWWGEKSAGRGHITEASDPDKVVVDLDLEKPAAGHLTLVFEIQGGGGKTKVDVTTSGPPNLVKSTMHALFDDPPGLIRLGCVAGGEPYTGTCKLWFEMFKP